MVDIVIVEMDDLIRPSDDNVYLEATRTLLKGLTWNGLAYLHFGPHTHLTYARATENAFAAARSFFSRPLSEKLTAKSTSILPTGVTRGYLSATEEAGGAVPELKEAFSWSADMQEGVPLQNLFQYPNIWPRPDKGNAMKSDFDVLFSFFYDTMCIIARALQPVFDDIVDDKLETHCHNGASISLARAFHYFSKEQQNGEVSASTGSAAHTDWGFATLVAQEAGSMALQAFQQGDWHSVVGMKDTLVLNGSDFLTLLSRGRLKSPLHRVVLTSEARFSFVYFQYPGYETRLPSLKDIDDDILSQISLLRDQRASVCLQEQQNEEKGKIILDVQARKSSPILLPLSDDITFGALMATKWTHVARSSQ